MAHPELYLNEKIETASQDELISRQNELLKEKVRYVVKNNAYMRNLYEKAGVVAEDFRGIEDIGKLPLLAKANFRETAWDVLRSEESDSRNAHVERHVGHACRHALYDRGPASVGGLHGTLLSHGGRATGRSRSDYAVLWTFQRRVRHVPRDASG